MEGHRSSKISIQARHSKPPKNRIKNQNILQSNAFLSKPIAPLSPFLSIQPSTFFFIFPLTQSPKIPGLSISTCLPSNSVSIEFMRVDKETTRIRRGEKEEKETGEPRRRTKLCFRARGRKL